VRADEVESSWQLFTPLLEKNIPVFFYEAGTWGPKEADEFIAHKGGTWLNQEAPM
jgi:glucose-6-phosphate 1-dehydrogenase